jgi:3-isopropylmalate/(R)-2-methylmalate dehydratase small subunit
MEVLTLEGRARVLGDDVNTDYIITSVRKREISDPQVLKRYLLETLDPDFAASVRVGDLLVAGRNFGCGSAMEVAVQVVLASGIKAVLARSFARTYFRNCVNNGLLPVECDTSRIREGDELMLQISDDVRVMNRTQGELVPAQPISRFVMEIVLAGGLGPYFKIHGDYGG